ncbi:hypothetical protein HUB98_08950 [Paenibacillus barcinonensis]|uniref:Uncharacterized protein n=1 Tax=Paenibacillus barcinonensis TaxID=198119 RepID=A0A2V4VN30_PAEBA|nr:hypothetical protein [Paenibacillus barcinonensis]PYE47551.1 hypothetical protein DFQ00_113145 [Paenibacillus barcinonensis]QKS56455.1 hypothetical protein HUB98_08950 [Paenibacillus barcinonensis]
MQLPWKYKASGDITYIYVTGADKYYKAVRIVKRLLGRKAAAELRTNKSRTRCVIKLNM